MEARGLEKKPPAAGDKVIALGDFCDFLIKITAFVCIFWIKYLF